MKRFINSKRYEDEKFRALSPTAKALFHGLEHVCNAAGFFSGSLSEISHFTGLSEEGCREVLHELEKAGYLLAHKGHYWLPDFLNTQGVVKYLNPRNNAHRPIAVIEEMMHREFFFDHPNYVRINFPGVGEGQAEVKTLGAEAELDPRPEEPDKPQTQRPRREPDQPAAPVVAAAVAAEAAPAAPAVSENEHRRISLNELRNAPKDWNEIKRRCMAGVQQLALTGPVVEALDDWWDHQFLRGNPYEWPMWSQLLMDVRRYGPAAVVEAIRYSRSNNMGTLNFAMAAKIVQQSAPAAPVTVRQDGQPVDVCPLDDWKSIFKSCFPEARVDFREWKRVPKSLQQQMIHFAKSAATTAA